MPSTTALFIPKGIQRHLFWDSTVKGWKHSGASVATAMSCSTACGKHVTTHYYSNPKYLKLFRLKVSYERGLICLKHEKHNTEVNWHYPHFHKSLQLLTDILQFKQEGTQIYTGVSTVRQNVWSMNKPALPSTACHCINEKQMHMSLSPLHLHYT